MKIKKISCTQFAGILDRDIHFTDGINVVYGKNESGKSTLVNLISRTLFQNARLDRRSDKDFFDLYFPGARRGSAIPGDFADGKITFETEKGTYTLSKEWGQDARCMLSTPDGVIRDPATIDALLKEALTYAEGVYADMLFSSQKNTDSSLQTILDASKKTDAKQQITDAVSQAFAETDGISLDAIEEAINSKIEEIEGKHWDLEREAPMRKAGRWASGLGEILKAYYAWEDANNILREISQLEIEADSASSDYTEKDLEFRKAKDAFDKFSTFASSLTLRSERRKNLLRLEQDSEKIKEALTKWPPLREALTRAKVLQKEKQNREILDKYTAAKKISDELKQAEAEINDHLCPTSTEISMVQTAIRGITTLENKLCGMNIAAVINMLGDSSVEITSLRTGESILMSDDTAAITEAVKITVPGVMEMQLSPADVDITSIEAQLKEQKNTIKEIFNKYKVASAEALEALAMKINQARLAADSLKNRLTAHLENASFDDLEAQTRLITADVRTSEEIEAEILLVCGTNDVTRFVAAKETIIEAYEKEYGTINDLKAKAFDLGTELQKLRDSVACAEDIPEEFKAIADPEAHQASLKNNLAAKQELREAALTRKTTATSRLEGYKENISGDPGAEAENAQRNLDEKKSLLKHWRHIAEVFKVQKESIHDNPMQDIADSFANYLSVISSGKISSEFPEADKLNMNIFSDNRLLDYGKLSEGTKETVSLAFRLAVLDHLFPHGGGVIVFDDPFTDMDKYRTAQACELIKKCAQKHQVIFLTCNETYLESLAGNSIRL